ncbi:MAG: ribonuclease HI [Woeseiaceae bacterium]|jgi:ribonuclease HI
MHPKPKIVENALVIYTDGSLYPKGRKGGYGLVFLYFDDVGEEHFITDHVPGGQIGTTNNRMELQAAIDAVKMAPDMDCFAGVNSVVIRTDSRYVSASYQKALGSWPQNKWRKYDGGRVENADLWKIFAREYRKVKKKVEIEWVKAHQKGKNKDKHNQAADRLAKESARGVLSIRTPGSSVRRKTSKKFTQKGSVRIEGQTMNIYIVQTEWMQVHKCWKYRYQVCSKDHPDYDCLDFLYADRAIQLRDGHYYEVTVNSDMANPEIVEKHRELEKEEIHGE